MTRHTAWVLTVAAFSLGGVALTVWRGWFLMPFHGRIERAKDPMSFWVICVFIGLIGAFLIALAL